METTNVMPQQETVPAPAAGGQKTGAALFKAPKKKRKWVKRLLILGAVALVLFLFVLRPMMSVGQQILSSTYIPQTVTMQALQVSVSSTGTVTPIDSYKVATLVTGEVLESPFEESDVVEKGALLYRFDAGDAENGVKQARLSLEQAQISYRNTVQSVSPYATATGVVQKLYVRAGDSVTAGTPIADIGDSTSLAVDIPFHSVDASTLYVGQAGTLTLEGTFETVPATIESISGADEVREGGVLVRQVRFRANNPGTLTASTTATAAVGAVSCAAGGTFQSGNRQTVVATVAGEIASLKVAAGDQVSYGQTVAVIGGTAADTALENARISLEGAQLSLERSQKALENYEVTAPISGTVIEKNFKAGDKVDSTSLTAAEGSLCVIFDMSTLTFDMKVDELDINKIQEGQEVEITADAIAGQTFRGTVDKVSINGTTAGGVTTYPVTVVVEAPGDLRPGMNVSAKVLVEDAGNVLCVPVDAVARGNTVMVAGAGALDEAGNLIDPTKLEQRAVTLGRNNSDYIEILSGLTDGEIVYIQNTASNAMAMMMGG